MYRLFYVSTASNTLSDEDVDAIVTTADRENRARDITGALGFNGVNFAQILEGDKAQVLSLFENIRKDSRHSGVILVGEKEIGDRAFKDWGMIRTEGLQFDGLVAAMAAV